MDTTPLRFPARRWTFATDEPSLAETAAVLADLAAPHLAALGDAAGDLPPGTLRLVLGETGFTGDVLGLPPGPDADETFALAAAPEEITCTGRTPQGVFRAAVSVLRSLAAGTLGPGRTADGPRYAWRGLLLDPARRFLPVPELLRLIDLAALHHLNVLHLHLTDNEGWRLEMAGRPLLTDGHDHYTAAQYREIQDYAARRFLTVVPEIDLPGHTAAVLRAYPELGTMPRPSWMPEEATPPLDPHDPATREFVAEVLSETARLTSGPFVHIGGDEAFGIDAGSFAEAVRFARATVRAAGRSPLGWQESSRAGVQAGDIVQWWVDVPMMELPADEAELAARPELVEAGQTLPFLRAIGRLFAPTDGDMARILDGGGRVLLSPQSHLYLDRPYDLAVVPEDQREAAARLGFTYRPRDLRYTAAWDPAVYGLRPDQVAGVTATLFGESLTSFDDITTLLLPRLASVAETAWRGAPQDWAEHRLLLAGLGRLWRQRGITALRSLEIDWR